MQPAKDTEIDVIGLHHAAVFVKDLDRAAAFYSNILSLETNGRAELPEIGIEQVFLSAGLKQADLVLARRLDGSVAPDDKRELFHLAFELPRTQDFEAFLAHVREHDVPILAGPVEHPSNFDGSGSRTSVYLQDPDGYLFEVTQERS